MIAFPSRPAVTPSDSASASTMHSTLPVWLSSDPITCAEAPSSRRSNHVAEAAARRIQGRPATRLPRGEVRDPRGAVLRPRDGDRARGVDAQARDGRLVERVALSRGAAQRVRPRAGGALLRWRVTCNGRTWTTNWHSADFGFQMRRLQGVIACRNESRRASLQTEWGGPAL